MEKRKREKKRKRKRRRREEKKKRTAKRYGTMTINMNTYFGLYGTTLDIRISSIDLSRVSS